MRRAKDLGDYLIVGVTSDSFDRGRGKLNERNNVLERVEAVKATGYADQIVIEDYVGQKIDDTQKYDVDIFAIGSDWEGKFDYLNEYCKVVYLPRTEGISSTMLREESETVFCVGIIGSGRIASRFVPYKENEGGEMVREDRFSNILIWVLENYGSQDNTLDGAGGNIGSFGWTGSPIPLFQSQIECMKQLLENKKMHSKVKKWANDHIKHYVEEIKREQNRLDFERMHYQ